MYSNKDEERVLNLSVDNGQESEEYRTNWRRDYARIIHCPSFRRLQGKTQLFPGIESDFFRNRLTHSLEVAQISKSIAYRINNRFHDHKGNKIYIEPDICEIAGLIHDLGHPPFGHQGEEALDKDMRDEGGFEGNAQTLRIIGKLEKKHSDHRFSSTSDKRVGLNLTYRVLASILKYDNEIPLNKTSRKKEDINKPVKGYYYHEKNLVAEIKSHVLSTPLIKGELFKTVECQIMDIADDIAYSVYDLEDGLKAGFFNFYDILFQEEKFYAKLQAKINKRLDTNYSIDEIRDGFFEIFGVVFPSEYTNINWSEVDFKQLVVYISGLAYNTGKLICNDGFLRTDFTSKLIGDFIRGIDFTYNVSNPSMSKVSLKSDVLFKVELLKTFNFESQILSPKLKVAEYRGKEIVHEIFKALTKPSGWMLMPNDCQLNYKLASLEDKKRVICDFIAGMTDRYAIEFYGRLKSENPETIFKPY